jgi:acetamidase/formamidase
VRVDRLTPRAGYGVISSRHGKGLLPDTFPAAPGPTSIFCRVDGDHAVLPVTDDPHAPVARFPLAPFLGVMGVATPGADRRDSVAPGEFGGNIDIALLGAGSVLYLPVLVPGAGFYVGDPHYAQGNGEIALTALEAPLHAELTIDLIPAGRVRELFGAAHGPIVRTSEFLVPTGLDPDLDAAVADCGRNAVALLGAAFGMAPERAYAYLSAAADFDISQVVDIVKGAHARIRMADFATVRELPWR